MFRRICNLKFLSTRLKATETQFSEVFLRRLNDNESSIAELALNRPASKNAISRSFLKEFENSIKIVEEVPDIRVLIIRSLVPGVFCSGADLKERAKMTENDVITFLNNLREVFNKLESLKCPTIAAIDDIALGGGLELALCCDMRICSNRARLGLVETKLAILPGAGGTQRLPRLINTAKAKELIYTGRVITGVDAEKLGLANYSVEQNESGSAAFLMAVDIAKEISRNGPIGVRLAKQAICTGLKTDLQSGLDAERAAYFQVLSTKDRIEGLKAFREKREPRYVGE